MVISYDQEYGPIGVVFGLMAFFIAVGAMTILVSSGAPGDVC
jgi:hypothetical protein